MSDGWLGLGRAREKRYSISAVVQFRGLGFGEWKPKTCGDVWCVESREIIQHYPAFSSNGQKIFAETCNRMGVCIVVINSTGRKVLSGFERVNKPKKESTNVERDCEIRG